MTSHFHLYRIVFLILDNNDHFTEQQLNDLAATIYEETSQMNLMEWSQFHNTLAYLLCVPKHLLLEELRTVEAAEYRAAQR